MGKLLTFDMVNRPKPVWGVNGGGHTHTHTLGCQRERKLTLISSVWFRYKSTTSCPFVNPACPHAGLCFRGGVITPHPPHLHPPTHPPHRHHHHSFSPPPPASFTLQTPESYLALLRRKEGHVPVGNKRLSVEEENQAHGHCVTRSSRDMLDRCPFLSAH